MTSATDGGRRQRVRLVVAAPGPGPHGLQEALVQEVRRLKAGDALRPLTILVGSNYLRLHLQRALAVHLGGHTNIHFLLLKDLARELGAAPLMDRGRRRLPQYGRDLLLRDTVAARAHGTYFEHIAETEGFQQALGATIRDLKDAGVDPASLRAVASGMRSTTVRKTSDEVSARKLDDLADLFETYDELLRDRRFYDDEDLMRSAVARASGPGPEILVYGFYDATWMQRSLIRECLRFRTGTAFFPFDAADPDASYEYARPMLEWFQASIQDRADIGPPPGGRPSQEVSFLSAPGEAREVVEATRWLVSLARERSVPFGEMGLLYRSPDPYLGLIGEVMAEAGGVPHFLAGGRPLSSTRSARALLMLLRADRDGLGRREVIECLTVACEKSDGALWDRLSREAGVVKGIADWRARLDRLASARQRLGSIDDAKALRDLRERVERLHQGLEALPREAPWRDMVSGAIHLAHLFGIRDAEVESRLSALGGLDEVASPVTRDRFLNMLGRSLQEATAGGGGQFQRSGIFVGDVMDARLLSFHAVAVVGLVEKGFPVPPRQDPILLDEERERVNRLVGADRLPLKARRLEEERLLFHLASCAAGESILLSYPRLDPADARPRNPSPFLLRAASRLEGRHVDYDDLDKVKGMDRVSLASLSPGDAGAALFSREFDLSVIRSALRNSNEMKRAASFLHSNPLLHRALQAEEARWGEPRFTAHDGVILRPNVLEALGSLHAPTDGAVSASRIESYAKCPLAYFMREVLDLKEQEDPEEMDRMDPLRRGALVHRILFEVFRTLADRGALPLTRSSEAEALAVLQETASRAFAEEDQQGVTGHRMQWEIDKERILDDLASTLSAQSADRDPFVPRHFELRYGMQPRSGEGEDPASTAAAVPLGTLGGRTVTLKGKVDRVDISRDGARARVTDYKTGKLTWYKEDLLLGGTTVQLPLYMIAVESVLKGTYPGLTAHEARYLSVDRRGGLKSVSFSAEALRSRREELARVVQTFLNGTARGVFFAYPEADVCRSCDYRLACGEGREARFGRKRADPTASDYLHVREQIA